MRRKNGRKKVEYEFKSTQAVINAALEWRKLLQISDQYCPDIGAILNIPPSEFPHITLQTFDDGLYPNIDVRGWASSGDRSVHLSNYTLKTLRYGDPQARWDAMHELAHLALGHPGNNLQSKLLYGAADKQLEAEVDGFNYNALAPFHLAKKLETIHDYATRFRIPYDKARIRKGQVDALKRQMSNSDALKAQLENLEAGDSQPEKVSALASFAKEKRPRKRTPNGAEAEQLNLFKSHDIPNRAETSQELPSVKCDVPIQPHMVLEGDDGASVIASEDQQFIEALVRQVNSKVIRRRYALKVIVVSFIALVGLSPLTQEAMDGLLKIALMVFSGIIGSVFAFFQIFDLPVRLEARFEQWAWSVLRQTASSKGVSAKLDRLNIVYQRGAFKVEKA